MVWAILCTDALQSMEYRTRPYEVEPGSTDRVVRESVDYLCEIFASGQPRGKVGSARLAFDDGLFHQSAA